MTNQPTEAEKKAEKAMRFAINKWYGERRTAVDTTMLVGLLEEQMNKHYQFRSESVSKEEVREIIKYCNEAKENPLLGAGDNFNAGEKSICRVIIKMCNALLTDRPVNPTDK